MTKHLAGTYIKAIGADFGLYCDGTKWISFQCLGCAIAQGLIIPSLRLINSDHPALNMKVGYKFTALHNKDIHNKWLKAGKPFIKSI